MISSIGIDIVEIKRIKKMKLDRLAIKILSDSELSIYNEIVNPDRKAEFLAGRFAAKEALFKCFKKGDLNANYKDFSILNNPDGSPYVISNHTKYYNVFISISHTKQNAICMVLLDK